jgi:hypothetical protein
MSVTTYGARRSSARSIFALIVANVAFAIGCLFWWNLLGLFVADPIAWATWAPLGRAGSPDYFRYPFGLLWMMPLGGALLGWMAIKLDQLRLARAAGMFPLMLLSLIFGWYYLAPIAWR